MKTLKNLVKTEMLNVEELMMIKGAAAPFCPGCDKMACTESSCTSCACSSGSVCTSNICSTSACSSTEGCSNIK